MKGGISKISGVVGLARGVSGLVFAVPGSEPALDLGSVKCTEVQQSDGGRDLFHSGWYHCG